MSHVSQVETEITDYSMLKKSLKDLNHKFEENVNISGKWINEKADLVLNINGDKNIGFRKNEDGIYNFVGDFFGKNKNSITEPILQRYSANVIKQNYVRMGVRSITEQVLDSGEIKIRGIVA